MEGLFALDQSAVEIKKILDAAAEHEKTKLAADDIKTIVLANEDFALVKVTKNSREALKYNGSAHVAVPLHKVKARGRSKKINEAQLMKEMMEHLLIKSKASAIRRIRSGIFITEPTEAALHYIQDHKPTAPVTRQQAANGKK